MQQTDIQKWKTLLSFLYFGGCFTYERQELDIIGNLIIKSAEANQKQQK